MALELTSRAVVAVSGPEARPFLQGLVTNDVGKAAPGHAIYAALLTPQGKILFDFLIGESDGALLIDCRKAARDGLVRRLTMYKLRAKVEIRVRDDLGVFIGEGTADPRLAALGPRAVMARIPAESGDAAYLSRRLDLGVPEGEDFAFDKGCYVGQELTARMKHRGKDRKRLLPIATTDGKPLPGRDVPVTAGDVELGVIASVYGGRGFALLRLDRLEAAPAPLEAAGVRIAVTKPDWLFT